MEKQSIHIGKIIEQKVKEQGLSIAEFARKINCVRENAYYIFRQQSIDIEKLVEISKVLNYNFLEEIYLQKNQFTAPPDEINIHLKNLNTLNSRQHKLLRVKIQEIADLLKL
ncbi:MAG: hypothetical protein LBN23_07975 [Paludibacter sp.]|jgi:transcriptional regulator with XRE-family HTH domain|nr:hypothetical protein [Paludibacter sp.]